jgi:hypothetical protein
MKEANKKLQSQNKRPNNKVKKRKKNKKSMNRSEANYAHSLGFKVSPPFMHQVHGPKEDTIRGFWVFY